MSTYASHAYLEAVTTRGGVIAACRCGWTTFIPSTYEKAKKAREAVAEHKKNPAVNGNTSSRVHRL